jgi:Mor family transcriptional regulator
VTVGRKGDDRLHRFVDELVSLGSRELAKLADMPEEEAKTAMTAVANSMCFAWGGQTVYVPQSLELRLTERDERIFLAYKQHGPTGSRPHSRERVEELAAEFELSDRHVYNIVALATKREQARRQPTLPGIDPAA